jgi:hypothetical protein
MLPVCSRENLLTRKNSARSSVSIKLRGYQREIHADNRIVSKISAESPFGKFIQITG